MNQGMETFEARLASFDTVLNPGKRRGSGTKPAKPISWPHSSPSPAELAHAGFYYEPHETNPDNARCFLCHSALDGWEEEDNPITEHLTLAPNCGWAIMMDIQRRTSNPAEIEDPTSERIVQARASTFGFSWPHDGKRGWVCQSEKMVAGGWYFCANEESNDLASCAYCKLSLDGWEPKDDPYEEHYRRSSDCSFFVFAQNQGKKTKSNRGRKPRSSKASRLSTQSASVEPSDDYGYQTDQSMMSDASTKPKNAKRTTKSRSKASRSRKADVEDTDDQMDVADDASPEPKPKRAARGKKRPSDQVDQGDFDGAGSVSPAPAPKKRATRTRGSAMRQASVDIDDSVSVMTQDQDDVASHDEEPKKGRRAMKKTSSTRGRKASETPSTTKATSKSRIPDDAELDAKLEADLEQDAEDYGEPEEPKEKATKSTSKKSKTKKSKAEPEPEPEPPVEYIEDPEDEAEEVPEDDEVEPVETQSRPQAKPNKSASKRKVKGSKSKEREPKSRASPEEDTRPSAPKRHEPENLSDAEPIDEVKTKKSKKAASDKTKNSKKTSKQPVAVPKPKEEIIDVEDSPDEEPAEAEVDIPDQEEEMSEPRAEEEEDQDEGQNEEVEQVESRPSRHQSSNQPHKTTERYSDIPHEQQFARSLSESQGSGARDEQSNRRHYDRQANGAISPIPSGLKSTPSLSPQSSDAENQPPSTKPSASRDRAPSPSKLGPARAPPASNTPSPSKQHSNAGGVESSQAWTPIDIEAILSALDIDRENTGKPTGDLTSLEKKMTVEEWIQWQAKNGEERLKQECERLVSHFEKEGGRAMRVLESIECID